MKGLARYASFDCSPRPVDGSRGASSTARLLRLFERGPFGERLVRLNDDGVVERLVAVGAQLQLVGADLEHEVVTDQTVEVTGRAGERAVDVHLRGVRRHLQ